MGLFDADTVLGCFFYADNVQINADQVLGLFNADNVFGWFVNAGKVQVNADKVLGLFVMTD